MGFIMYKRQLLFVILLGCSIFSNAVYSQTKTENYIKTIEPKEPEDSKIAIKDKLSIDSNTSSGTIDDLPIFTIPKSQLEKVVYYDGLGRPKQEILVGIGGRNDRNIITHIEYELNGVQKKEYLPFVENYIPNDDDNYGPSLAVVKTLEYSSSAKDQTLAFYNTDKYEKTTNPYFEKTLERSPLKRIQKQGSPGEPWKVGTTSDKHNTDYTYGFNLANQVKKFVATATWNTALGYYDVNIADQGYHPKNSIYWNSVQDENKNTVSSFIDLEDKIILSRSSVFNKSNSGIGNINNIGGVEVSEGKETFSIGKELQGKSLSEIVNNAENIGQEMLENTKNQVQAAKDKMVNSTLDTYNSLKERAEKGMGGLIDPTVPIEDRELFLYGTKLYYTYYIYDQYNNLVCVLPPLAEEKVDTNTIDKLGYQYRYDQKNRLVAKKLPGKEWEYTIYNKIDQMILSGPVYNPFGNETKGWMFSKYDINGRLIYSGYYDGETVNAASRKKIQDAVDTQSVLFEKKVANNVIDQVQVPYSNESYPKSNIRILSVHYYDDYNFVGESILTTGMVVNNQLVKQSVKGLATGTWERILTNVGAKGITTYSLYDDKNRIVRSKSTNAMDGYIQEDNTYNFRGLLTEKTTIYKYNTSSVDKKIKEIFKYDWAERLWYQTHQIDDQSEVVLFEYEYDELGKVRKKRIGGTRAFSLYPFSSKENVTTNDLVISDGVKPTRSSFLQEIKYNYNIRGWLTKVNDVNDLNAGTFGKKALFASQLSYNQLTSSGIDGIKEQYNGNITEQLWKTAQDNVLRKYSYGYDELSRLKKGVFQMPEAIVPITGTYNEEMTYDSNGNILTLNRKGQNVNDGLALDLDVLKYTYDGNILKQVIDQSGNTDGFKQVSTDTEHYTYDALGNFVTDKNKGISKIKYNHLNLPVEIAFGTDKIEYLYTATGVKLQKKVTQRINNQNKVVTTDYVNGFQYVDGVLQFFGTAEGYFDVGLNNYVYQHKDHLGNIRLSYSDTNKDGKIDNSEIIEETNYYPFGLTHSGYNQKNNAISDTYKYQYNAKEKQEELGLNVYDYGARNYDAAIGRWMNVDPLAEKYPSWTPYHYVHNNPMNLIDPTGMEAEGGGWFSKAWSEVKSWFSDKPKTNVIVEPIVYNGIAKPMYEEKTDNGYRVHGYKLSGTIGNNVTSIEGNLSGFSAGYEGQITNNEISGNASVYALSGDSQMRLGTKEYNFTEKVEGSALKAEAKGTMGMYNGDNGKYGFKLTGEASAIGVDGSYSPSITIGGYRIGITRGTSIGSAHIGGNVSSFYNTITKEGEFSVMGHFGFGAGVKVGFTISNTNQEFYPIKK